MQLLTHVFVSPLLDPFTTFVVTITFTALTAIALEIVHPALTEELKPAAADWRIGTLLAAGSAMLFAVLGLGEIVWVLPVANAGMLFAATLYWRALRRLFGDPDRWEIFAPAIIAIVLLVLGLFVWPHYGWRVLIGAIAGSIIAISAAFTILKKRGESRLKSGFLLAAVFVFTALFMSYRGLSLFPIEVAESARFASSDVMNSIVPIVYSLLPTIGTTTFALMLFERIRRDLHLGATIDALTGLPNRRTISGKAAERFDHAKTRNVPFSIALIDVDHFKQINDQFGHEAGDVVLRGVAKTLNDNARGLQFVGRWGGEEFVVLLEDASLRDASIAAERLRNAAAETLHAVVDPAPKVTVSIGIATIQPGDDSFSDILQRADGALYAAKAAGRNCVRSESDPVR